MSATFTEYITLEKIECGNCAGVYALNSYFVQKKREESGGWHCPYCNQHRGFWESEANKLRKELEAKSKALTASRCETLNERNLREAAEKKLRRNKNGVCACCNRSFQNLGRHMKTKHPDFLGKP